MIKPPDYLIPSNDTCSVFLAGGISNCHDWQQDVADQLKEECPELVVINPRCDDFDVSDKDASKRQIAWEYKHLQMADIISFVFTDETIQPITLLEFGRWSYTNKPICVCVYDGYVREEDVMIQLGLARPGVKVHAMEQSLCCDIGNRYREWKLAR
jgi:hypothetical protein